MFKKTFIIFLVSVASLFVLFETFSGHISERELADDAKQAKIIHETIKDRFKVFLNLPLSFAMIGSHFHSDSETFKDEDPFKRDLLELNKEILGLTLMDENGKIIRVFPPETNPNAIGKVTQNLAFLKQSVENKEKLWLSQPFNLYQGGLGFAFYIPVYRNSNLAGWFASVIKSELFVEQFKLSQFLESYDLIIKDKQTDVPYFATAISPVEDSLVHETEADVHGRKLMFQSWRKGPTGIYKFPWYWSFLSALVLASGIAVLFRFYQQRKAARQQLQDISILLRFTAKEAVTRLIELQTQFYKLGSPENISYVTNLIEQIDLLETMAHTGEGLKSNTNDFLLLLRSELDYLREVISTKNLTIHYTPAHFSNVKINANSWLLQNTVLRNILTHSIINAESGSQIDLSYEKTDESHFITFHTQNLHIEGVEVPATHLDRRLDVVRKVLNLHNGELYLQTDLAGGLIVRIILPL